MSSFRHSSNSKLQRACRYAHVSSLGDQGHQSSQRQPDHRGHGLPIPRRVAGRARRRLPGSAAAQEHPLLVSRRPWRVGVGWRRLERSLRGAACGGVVSCRRRGAGGRCDDCLRRLRRRWRQCVRPPASCSVSRGSPECRRPRCPLLRYSSASLLLCYFPLAFWPSSYAWISIRPDFSAVVAVFQIFSMH